MHLQKIAKWIANQKNIECLYVDYNAILIDPFPAIEELQRFLQKVLDAKKIISAVDISLYRNRL